MVIKKAKSGWTAIALVMGVVSVCASKTKTLTTTYTANGQIVSKDWVMANCVSGNMNLCASEYIDGAFYMCLYKD